MPVIETSAVPASRVKFLLVALFTEPLMLMNASVPLPSVINTTSPAANKLILPSSAILPAALNAVVFNPPERFIVPEVISMPPVRVLTSNTFVVPALVTVKRLNSLPLPPIFPPIVTSALPASISKN